MEKEIVGTAYVLAYDDGTFDYNVNGNFNIIPAAFTSLTDVLADMVKDGVLYKEDVPLLFDKYKKTEQMLLMESLNLIEELAK